MLSTRFASFALILVSFAFVQQASSRILGFSVTRGEPVQAGAPFDVTFRTQNSPTNNEQYYVLFGLHGGPVSANTIGSQAFANQDLTKYNKAGKNFTLTIDAPSGIYAHSTQAQQQNLTAAILSQTGASGGLEMLLFTEQVTVIPNETY